MLKRRAAKAAVLIGWIDFDFVRHDGYDPATTSRTRLIHAAS